MVTKRFKTDCLCLQTRRADRILTQLYDSFIRQTGLKSTQYGLLRCIDNFVEPCLADIRAAMCMDQTTVSRNISKLQRGGYISTSSSTADPRKSIISITKLGYDKMAEAKTAWEKAQLAVKEQLGDEVFERLYDLLGKIPEKLDYDA